MVSKEEFLKYVKEIINNKNSNEDSRYLSQGYQSISGSLLVIGLISFFAGLVLSFSLFSGNSSFGGFLVISGVGVICCIIAIVRMSRCDKRKKYYRDNYREKVISFLLKDCDYFFYRNEYIDEQIFKDSQFGGRYEDYEGSDKLSINIPNDDGSKSNNYLNLCDLNVTKTETDSDGDSKTVTVYEGVFGYIDFPLEFKCLLCLNTRYSKRGIKSEKVILEDINFNKKFKVYSDNQIEARYILTPSMMEKLLYLNSKLGRVEITLVDNRMYFGFSYMDLFELKSIKYDMVETIFENFYDEIDVILKIVEEIKDNNKVFKI